MFPKPVKQPKRRGHRDPLLPAEREYVLRRDGMCFGYRVDPTHACRDAWGNPHSPYDLSKLTAEHVKEHLRMGRRADCEDGRCRVHTVALCAGLNIGVPSPWMREAMRAYLRVVEGQASS